METVFNLLMTLAIPTCLGYALLRVLIKDNPLNTLSSVALSCGLGFGVLAQWMLLIGILGLPYSLFSISLPLVTCSILMLYFSRHRIKKITSHSDNFPSKSFTKIDHFIFFLIGTFIVYVCIFVFWRNTNVPILEWDAISTIAFKAKIFFYEQSLYQHRNLPHSFYPLQTPFMLTWTALNLGRWDEQFVKIIFPAMFLSFLILYYTFLKVYTNRVWSFFGIVLLLSSNFLVYHTTIAYRDFLMLYYNCITIMLLFLWHKFKNDEWILIAGLFAGFTTFTKLEGTGYLLCQTILFLVFLTARNKGSKKIPFKNIFKFVIPSYGLCLSYFLYKFLVGATGATQQTDASFTQVNLNKILFIISKFLENMFLSGNWNVVWVLFVVSLISIKKYKNNFTAKVMLCAVALYFSLYFFVALFTPNYISIVGEESPTVLSRVFLHFFPLATLAIILINAPKAENKIKQHFKFIHNHAH